MIPNSIIVMTRNVYFGTDVDYVMGATSLPDLIQRVAIPENWPSPLPKVFRPPVLKLC